MCRLRMGLLLTSGLHVRSYGECDEHVGWNVTERNSCLGWLTPEPILHRRIILRRWLRGLSPMCASPRLYRRRA